MALVDHFKRLIRWSDWAMGIRAFGDMPLVTRDKVDTLTVDHGYNIAKMRQELGYCPTVDYDQGLWWTVKWCQGKGYLS